MKPKKKKQKKTKPDDKKQVWKCDVVYSSQSQAAYIKAWKIYVKREESFLNALLRKRDLERQLSLVRIELIDLCIWTTRRGIVRGNKKLKAITNTKNIKTAKRKRL